MCSSNSDISNMICPHILDPCWCNSPRICPLEVIRPSNVAKTGSQTGLTLYLINMFIVCIYYIYNHQNNISMCKCATYNIALKHRVISADSMLTITVHGQPQLFKKSPTYINLFKGVCMCLPSIQHISTYAFIHSLQCRRCGYSQSSRRISSWSCSPSTTL